MSWFEIHPCPAPRQVRSDKWDPRPAVVRYRAFRDKVRALGVQIPASGVVAIRFEIAVPPSWSDVRKARAIGQPHQQRPDLDNLVKSLLDACLKKDAHVWSTASVKVWGRTGRIWIGNPDDFVPAQAGELPTLH